LLRKVPEDLHREVKAAAAHAGMSMQDLILKELERFKKSVADVDSALSGRKG
jgi:predicted HicB family RNase H-like nuclease